MDILALGYYRALEWPSKPQALIDLDELLKSSQKRREKRMDMTDVYRIKDKIMEDDGIKDYMNKLSTLKSLNYGNYDWLLQLKEKETDAEVLERIESMLNDFRRIYWDKNIGNLPATRIIQADYDANVKIQKANMSDELVDKLVNTFSGTEVTGEEHDGQS